MKKITLTQGKFALVDNKDFKEINKLKWHVQNVQGGRRFYAVHTTPRVNGKQTLVRMHVLIMGTPKGMDTDHIDNDGLNNQRSNLRICTRSENCCNKRRRIQKTSSNFKGVSWHKGRRKWQVAITRDKVRHYLGLFENIEDAKKAYVKASKEIHGEFSNTKS